MTPEPAPPVHLNKSACAAWKRIYRHLAARGEWDDLYLIPLELAAGSCSLYLRVAAVPGADPALLEEVRLNARRALAEMCYISKSRINFATLTESGLDAEIVSICEPLA